MNPILAATPINTTAWSFDNLKDFENSAKYFYYLHLSHADISMNSSIVLATTGFVCLLAATLTFSSFKRPIRPSKPSDSLQALFTVVAPTSVAWPRDYARLVEHRVSSRSKTIAISMISFIENVCDGAVEVRNNADLPELFSAKLVVYGWHVRMTLDTPWSLEVLKWVVGTHFSWKQLGASEKQNARRALKRTHGASTPKAPTPAAAFSFSVTSNTHLDLDYIPFSRLESSLLQLRNILAPGTIASLEFTAPAHDLAFLSPAFNICAVPFVLLRKYNGGGARGRTATPLLASLHRVLELLTAGPAALALESVSNISKTYAGGLNAAGEHLEEDSATRTAFIQQWGVTAWREQRLMAAWEAALFSAGYLARWVVVVRK